MRASLDADDGAATIDDLRIVDGIVRRAAPFEEIAKQVSEVDDHAAGDQLVDDAGGRLAGPGFVPVQLDGLVWQAGLDQAIDGALRGLGLVEGKEGVGHIELPQ